MIKTIIPMKNKSSTEMLININREVFGDQLLICFFPQKIGIEGRCMLFEVFACVIVGYHEKASEFTTNVRPKLE